MSSGANAFEINDIQEDEIARMFAASPKTYDSQSNSLFFLKPSEATVSKARFIGQVQAFAECKRRCRESGRPPEHGTLRPLLTSIPL
jgi:hypothetical protein